MSFVRNSYLKGLNYLQLYVTKILQQITTFSIIYVKHTSGIHLVCTHYEHRQVLIKFRIYTLSSTTRWMLIHFNTYFIKLATCFGYIMTIIRPTRTVKLALDAARSGMKHLLFTPIIKIYLKGVIKYWYLINCKTL
jgi:hypothetical protein